MAPVIFVPFLVTYYIGVPHLLLRFTMWFALWIGAHYAVVPVMENILLSLPGGKTSKLYIMIQRVKSKAENDGQLKKLYNLRRHFRSQVYCIFASTAGFYLLFTTYSSNYPHCWLHDWNPLGTVFFEIAAANWMFACMEDAICEEEVTNHMLLMPSEPDRMDFAEGFLNNLFNHHFLTIFAYSWALYSRYLGGLCCFGLIFETPVILINMRDICAAFAEELDFPHRHFTIGAFRLYSYTLQFLFHTCRTSFCLLWPISLAIWREELNTVPIWSRVVYHILGLSFCIVNFMLLSYHFTRYTLDDTVRAGLLSRETFWRMMREKEEVITKFLEKEKAAAAAAAAEENALPGDDLEKAKKAGCPHAAMFSAAAAAVAEEDVEKKYTMEQVLLHNTKEDAWIVIDDAVYDISSFIEKHPGGSAVLLKVMGVDSSEQFHAVGHSRGAHRMMEKYRIGKVAAAAGARLEAEQQQQKQALRSKPVGDTTPERELQRMDGPYHFMKPYFVHAYNIVMPSLALSTIASAFVALSMSEEAATSLGFAGATGRTSLRLTNNLVFNLLRNSLSASIVCCIIFACMGNVGVFRLQRSEIVKMLLSPKAWIIGALFALWVNLEMTFFLGFGLAGSGQRVYNAPILWKLYKLSFIFTMAIETYVRKVWFLLGVSPRSSVIPYIRPATDKTMLLMLAVLLVEVSGYYRYMTKTDNGFEDRAGYWSLILLMMIAVPRSCFFRCLPDRTCSEDQAGHSLLAMSILGTVIIATTASVFFSTADSAGTSTLLFSHVLSNFGDQTKNVLLISFAAFVYSLARLIRWSNACFAAQSISVWLVFSIYMVTTSLEHARWIGYALWMVAMFFVSAECWATICNDKSAPRHLFTAKQIEDTFRYTTALMLTRFIFRPILEIVSVVLPNDFKLWMYPGPVSDLGEDCDYGIAFQVNGKPQKEPTTFVCNVGHFGNDIYDYARTGSSTKDMIMELMNDPEAGEKGWSTH